MRRVVLDPGILVSAVISPTGASAELLDAWRGGLFDAVVSPKLLDELQSVLLRPKFRVYASTDDVEAYVEALAAGAIAFDDPVDPPRVTGDPGDDYLVALARVAQADVIVSGDKHLTQVADLEVPVVSPRELLGRLER